MAQYDLLLEQNVHATLIEYTERFVHLDKGDLLSADTNHIPTVLDAGTDGYYLKRDDAAATGLVWVAAPTGCSFGTDNQIPYTNSAGTNFDYSPNLTFNGSTLYVNAMAGFYGTDSGSEVFIDRENGSFNQVWRYATTPAWVNYTSACNTYAYESFIPFPTNIYSLYLGKSSQWSALYCYLYQVAVGQTTTFEYSRGGGSWGTLTVTDNTNNFTVSEASILWTPPGDWATDTVNGTGPYYWIRLGSSTTSSTDANFYSISPTEKYLLRIRRSSADGYDMFNIDPSGNMTIGSNIKNAITFLNTITAAGNISTTGYLQKSASNTQTTFINGLYLLGNSVATAVYTVQNAPVARWYGYAWDTGDTLSKANSMEMGMIPISGDPTSCMFVWKNYYVDAIADSTQLMWLTSGGVLKILNGIQVDHINEYNSAHGVEIDGILLKDYIIDAQDGSLKHLYIYAGDASGAAGTDAGNLYLRAGNAIWADAASSPGSLYLVPGSPNASNIHGTIYLGNSSFTSTSIDLITEGSGANIDLYIYPKGSGTLVLGGAASGNTVIYGGAAYSISLGGTINVITNTATFQSDGYNLNLIGASGTSGHVAGYYTYLKGGAAHTTGDNVGGHVYIYGGAGNGAGIRGGVYFGDGSSIATLPAKSAETNIIYYDTTTGKLSYATAPTGGSHTMLDGSTHTDSVVQTVSRGSIIYGNSTPKWSELVIGTAGYHFESDGTDIAWVQDITMSAGSNIVGGHTIGNVYQICGWDVDGASAYPFITISASNTPTCDLDSTVTIASSVISRVSGTPADSRVAVWTGAIAIEGDAGFTYDPATDCAYINGYLGINVAASTSYRLYVSGNAYFTTNLGVGVAPSTSYAIYGYKSAASEYAALFNNAANATTAWGIKIKGGDAAFACARWIYFEDSDGSGSGLIQSTGASDIVLIPASDLRIKCNIKEIDINAIDLLLRIPVNEFELIKQVETGNSKPRWGYIAQYVEPEFPRMVTYDEDADMYYVDKTQLIPVFHKSILQLNDKFETLEQKQNKKIKALEKGVKDLRKELDNLSTI